MSIIDHATARLDALRADGPWKSEGPHGTPRAMRIEAGGRSMPILCANNHLGLADHPVLVAAARASPDRDGDGTASVRFTCGTHDLHRV